MSTSGFRLGVLADAQALHAPIEIAGVDASFLQGGLQRMIEIRVAEEIIGDGITAGTVRCPCHLGIGQEAIAVGVSASLRATDRVFGGHRSHAHYLALGGSVQALFDEVLGKASGCSGGMGGSQHLYGGEVGFRGSVPIVAGTVPLAAGAALAARMDGAGDIGVAYFGDGACEEGVVHEVLNMAAAMHLPMLFVCENNLFSSHLHIDLRQPGDRVGRYAEAHGIACELVDGNDLVAVRNAAAALIEGARSGRPGFLEAVTYRWRGHVGAREDVDVGVNRTVDLAAWKRRDPISRLAAGMAAHGRLAESVESVTARTRAEFLRLWAQAEAAPYPEADRLLHGVYA